MKSIVLFLLICFSLTCQAQDEKVPFNGYVCDILGHPIKGVKVWVTDERRYARSDKKGRFGLTDVAAEDTIHLRYRKQNYDIPVAGRRSLSLKLADQLMEAEEDERLVDQGYGYVSKRECTISHGGISGEELLKSGSLTILGALQGRIAGLYISSSSRLGGGETVNIRGVNSINLSTEPLYVVDGVVVDSLDYISLYDVDYVEVLKDSSIYGSRGACGVILVHTKRGPKISGK